MAHEQHVFTPPKLLAPDLQPAPGARPGLVLFVQSLGDFVNFNPHVHVLAELGPHAQALDWPRNAVIPLTHHLVLDIA